MSTFSEYNISTWQWRQYNLVVVRACRTFFSARAYILYLWEITFDDSQLAKLKKSIPHMKYKEYKQLV